MKNSSSIKNAVKAFLAVALFSLGFARAAAHVSPTQVNNTHLVNDGGTGHLPPTMDH